MAARGHPTPRVLVPTALAARPAVAASAPAKQRTHKGKKYNDNKGPSKKKPTGPGVYLINFRGTNQPQIPNPNPKYFFLPFFFSAFFWRFSARGVQKHY
jgi:hypothetical protein